MKPYFIQRCSKWRRRHTHFLQPDGEAKAQDSSCYFQFLFQTVWPLFEPLAPLVAASPRWLLGCSPLPLPLPSLSPSLFILHLYLVDWKRPGIAQLLPWEKEQSSYQPEAQMYCTGLCSPAESAKCFRRDARADLCCLILVASDVRRLRWKKNLRLALIKGTGCLSVLMLVTTMWWTIYSLRSSRCSLSSQFVKHGMVAGTFKVKSSGLIVAIIWKECRVFAKHTFSVILKMWTWQPRILQNMQRPLLYLFFIFS